MRPPLMKSSAPMTRINVTPIIDVALTLVVVLLVTAPMLSVADLKVELPAARARDAEETGFISVTASRSGEIAVDERLVAGAAEVPAALRARIAELGKADAYVVVRADAGLPYAVVSELLDAARQGGASRLGVATRQKTGGGA